MGRRPAAGAGAECGHVGEQAPGGSGARRDHRGSWRLPVGRFTALFVTETLRGLAAGESGVPESLRAAVLARLRRAGPDTDELLRAGAVLGATVDPAVVGGLLGVPEHVAAHRCERAAASRLLVLADRTYEFANDLVQEGERT